MIYLLIAGVLLNILGDGCGEYMILKYRSL